LQVRLEAASSLLLHGALEAVEAHARTGALVVPLDDPGAADDAQAARELVLADAVNSVFSGWPMLT
jgi:hypothetical protein